MLVRAPLLEKHCIIIRINGECQFGKVEPCVYRISLLRVSLFTWY